MRQQSVLIQGIFNLYGTFFDHDLKSLQKDTFNKPIDDVDYTYNGLYWIWKNIQCCKT